MFAFGALDLYAFYLIVPKMMRAIEDYTGHLFNVLFILISVSLIVSGPLIMMGNRIGYVIYYFQFPMKCIFLSGLTFGFLSLIPVATGTLYFGMLWATIFALEAIRLMHTIQTHRRVS